MRHFFVIAAIACVLALPCFAGFNTGSMGGPEGFGGGKTASTCCVLDGLTSGIKAAYSTRKLLSSYAGNAMQIERASDSTTQNIGFVSNTLDTGSINTFCSGTTCTVTIWYDQSGSGYNLAPPGTNVPVIYQSGAIVTINSTRPAISFASATTQYFTNATLPLNPVNTLFMNAVADFTGSSIDGGIVGGSVTNNLEWRVDVTTLNIELLASSTANLGTATLSQNASGSVLEVQYNSSTGAGSFWVDGAAAGTFTNAHAFAGGGVTSIGANSGNAEYFNGQIGEVIMYDLVGGIPSGTRTSIESNQKTYWGTP